MLYPRSDLELVRVLVVIAVVVSWAGYWWPARHSHAGRAVR
ncbi:hypothetical protein [Nocardia stercoris]|nr:hypothetical protein [Nocardia stercoris]